LGKAKKRARRELAVESFARLVGSVVDLKTLSDLVVGIAAA
jgi:hypothetical protein